MKKYKLIQIASHLGEHKDGVEGGPSVIVDRFRMSHEFEQYFDSDVVSIVHPEANAEHESGEYEKLKNLPQIADSYCEVFEENTRVINEGFIPVNIVGSDEVAAPIFNAVSNYYQRDEVAIIWIDSHPDLNDAVTTPSGNIHGMSLALALGYGDERLLSTRPSGGFLPKDAVLVGPGEADIDEGEMEFIQKHSMVHFLPNDIRKKGSSGIVNLITSFLQSHVKTKVAVHFDLDCIDPTESPGVSVPALDANSFNEMYDITKGILHNFELVSFNLAEYNPKKDPEGVTLKYALKVLTLLK